ncbi:phosphopantetheine-binding protein [Comamonadaceae bacterium G21597-S1]|nr:phosphopantetheine-binding protein [Comamonadaceae bacterium G21597-S1]
MKLDKQDIVASIKRKIMEIADQLGCDASELENDEIIPATGLIDSAGLLDLIGWFESTYDFRVAAEDFTIDNLGSMDAMADFLLMRKGQK